jgi:release factor glutamine methyltransferase
VPAAEKKSANSKFFFRNAEMEIFPGVYEPAEDSLLLCESVVASDVKGKACIDVGCGSGIQSINLAMHGAAKVVCVDVNEKAVENALHNAKKLGFGKIVTALQSDLFGGVDGKFDVIVFNPPYLESETLKERELDGGRKGREVLDRFLEQAGKHLNKHGKIYFLQSSLNGIVETEEILGKLGFNAEVVVRKRIFFEELLVFKAWKEESITR